MCNELTKSSRLLLIDFHDEVFDEISPFHLKETHLHRNIENAVAHGGWIVRIIENAHGVFLGSDDEFAFSFKAVEHLEDIGKVTTCKEMVIIKVHHLDFRRVLAQVTHKRFGRGDTGKTQDGVIIM